MTFVEIPACFSDVFKNATSGIDDFVAEMNLARLRVEIAWRKPSHHLLKHRWDFDIVV